MAVICSSNPVTPEKDFQIGLPDSELLAESKRGELAFLDPSANGFWGDAAKLRDLLNPEEFLFIHGRAVEHLLGASVAPGVWRKAG
jgi:hypothetical protein